MYFSKNVIVKKHDLEDILWHLPNHISQIAGRKISIQIKVCVSIVKRQPIRDNSDNSVNQRRNIQGSP